MREITITILAIVFLSHTLFAQLFNQSVVLTQADRMPYFPGCDEFEDGSKAKRDCSNQSLIKYISNNLIYPETARSAAIEGTAYVSFVVNEKGAVIEPYILKDIGGGCGEAALAVIRQMPRWEPGRHEGKTVSVRLNLPVQFSLTADQPDLSEKYNIFWGGLNGDRITTNQLRENLPNTILVRDPLGNTHFVNELIFVLEKKKKIISARNEQGRIAGELLKVVKKAKKGGKFTITASIQDGGEVIWVSRAFEIVE